ncbi:MAG: glycosyltransferase family 2 protein [Kiritimatiellae bacterium]|nr:glycosyltransferase family 2 protein [Kiritimatiellia bacterium]
MGNLLISIGITSYNRAEMLRACLEALTRQTIPADRFEVVVADNNSTDNTLDMLATFRSRLPHLVIAQEHRRGVGYARNRTIVESSATTEWLAELDDDSEPFPDWLERVMAEIGRDRFDAFGGHVIPKPYGDLPKWYRKDYGDSDFISATACSIPKGPYYFIGCNSAYRKAPLRAVGGFPSSILGKRGARICHWEETNAQVRMLRAGYRLGYVPDIKAYHFVRPDKCTPRYFLRVAYGTGRDSWAAMEDRPALRKILRIIASGHYRCSLALLRAWRMAVPSQSYYPTNLWIDAISPLYWMVGSLVGARDHVDPVDRAAI